MAWLALTTLCLFVVAGTTPMETVIAVEDARRVHSLSLDQEDEEMEEGEGSQEDEDDEEQEEGEDGREVKPLTAATTTQGKYMECDDATMIREDGVRVLKHSCTACRKLRV